MNLPFTPVDLQLEDILDAAQFKRFGFFYEVGAGKTFVSTVVAKLWDLEHTFVICPPILVDQWARWLKSVNEEDVSVYRTTSRTSEDLLHKWVVMSHAIFRRDFKEIYKLVGSKLNALIVDEAQAIKNRKSKLYKYVRQFCAPEKPILMLTATPISKPEDTFTYMRIKTPNIYRTFRNWERCHVEETDYFGTVKEYKNLDMLNENFALVSVTRDKRELFGYTLKPIYDPIYYRLSKQHYKLYEKLVEEQLLLLPDGDIIDATTAQKLRHQLQQIVLNYGHFAGDESKQAAGIELLDEVINQVQPQERGRSKLIVWTYYKRSSRLVLDHLQAQFGDRAVVGAWSETNSRRAVEQIMYDDACRVLVAQPTSVGMGLNLHEQCSEMLFLESSTSPMHTKQALGRIDRAGQTVAPTIRFAVALDTIQVSLLNKLLSNDDLVSKVEQTRGSLKRELLGV